MGPLARWAPTTALASHALVQSRRPSVRVLRVTPFDRIEKGLIPRVRLIFCGMRGHNERSSYRVGIFSGASIDAALESLVDGAPRSWNRQPASIAGPRCPGSGRRHQDVARVVTRTQRMAPTHAHAGFSLIPPSLPSLLLARAVRCGRTNSRQSCIFG